MKGQYSIVSIFEDSWNFSRNAESISWICVSFADCGVTLWLQHCSVCWQICYQFEYPLHLNSLLIIWCKCLPGNDFVHCIFLLSIDHWWSSTVHLVLPCGRSWAYLPDSISSSIWRILTVRSVQLGEYCQHSTTFPLMLHRDYIPFSSARILVLLSIII